MTHPRKHDNDRGVFVNDVAVARGVYVSVRDYNRLVDAYLADHPEHAPTGRAGIRGNASRLGLPGLPAGWERDYLHMLGIAAPPVDDQ